MRQARLAESGFAKLHRAARKENLLAQMETTICKFRHLMERKGLGERLFGLVNAYRVENGLTVRGQAIVPNAHLECARRPAHQRNPGATACRHMTQLEPAPANCRYRHGPF